MTRGLVRGGEHDARFVQDYVGRVRVRIRGRQGVDAWQNRERGGVLGSLPASGRYRYFLNLQRCCKSTTHLAFNLNCWSSCSNSLDFNILTISLAPYSPRKVLLRSWGGNLSSHCSAIADDLHKPPSSSKDESRHFLARHLPCSASEHSKKQPHQKGFLS
jgi:hypothetical protein